MSGLESTRVDGSFREGGVHLHYRGWQVRDPAATVAVVHGLAEHGGRYETVGRALASGGVSTWALDLRGHGLSGGRRGHVDRFERFLLDLERFRTELLERAPDTPMFLLGHSMGGLISLRYLEEYPAAFRGAVVTSPWLGTVAPVPRWKSALAKVLGRVAPALPVPAGIPAEHLSHDAAVVRGYVEDPLVHDTVTPRLFREAGEAMELAFRRAGRIRGPTLFVLAGEDRIADTERSLALARLLPHAEVIVAEGLYHEVLNESQAPEYIQRIAAWIRERAGGRPGEG